VSRLKMETDPLPETLCFTLLRLSDDGQSKKKNPLILSSRYLSINSYVLNSKGWTSFKARTIVFWIPQEYHINRPVIVTSEGIVYTCTCHSHFIDHYYYYYYWGLVVKALGYKPEGRGFETR
jgi:hypothetical protein